MAYKMYNPHQHLSQAYELTPEQWERVQKSLTKADLADIENGGKVKVGAAAFVWKVS